MQSPGGAIRFGDYKLLEYFENNTVQLFNLKVDPGEQNDLAQSQPEKADELLKSYSDEIGNNTHTDGTIAGFFKKFLG